MFMVNSIVFFIIGILSSRTEWVNNVKNWVSDIIGKLNFPEYAMAIAFIALIFQIRQFNKDSNRKYIETLDNWLIGFQNLISEKRLHENWGTFAINMINQADRICYFVLKKLIRDDLVEFFKDQITSAYTIGFTDKGYLETYFQNINIKHVRQNAESLEIWCKQAGWTSGNELLPIDKKTTIQ